jgi:hypothetical protein
MMPKSIFRIGLLENVWTNRSTKTEHGFSDFRKNQQLVVASKLVLAG